MPEGKSGVPRGTKKEVILKALIDPKFSKLLATEPGKALGGVKITAERLKEIAFILGTVKGLRAQIDHLADELLCAWIPC